MAAPVPARPTANARKPTMMRPPPVPRPGINRAQTATPTLNGRATPSDSNAARQKSPKRKLAEMMENSSNEETNINVVVRCRGRNDREVRENSAVVVSSDGIKGSKVELSMGPNALSNKAYQFDKVFSPAADQEMIYDEVVAPILDEVLAGFNCTIFAYGQTGTGKTFTMSGDISDTLPIPEAAGIIPRVLHDLFGKISADENDKLETTVKCSFIELYNEELRDLLAVDDSTKLKIFDDANNKNGRTTTLIQGMEETYIESASKGIRLLSEGSNKRQVAATRCNDLSSRSHTVFTMTIYTKRPSESGEDHISASKLNLVDLAGSENIQRSGAENKRAAEAGLINKSLLTLGRVINALVDRSPHIPYRESKLTRLLQDSLGGRTKTCIIATLSPAKSNLEETISTLDYAFRAKNIRNKPQMNQLISKKTLLREFTTEIEKLKSELIATRHRNGYYLTADAYEELTTQSESRRILSEEQRDKIETMEVSLRNKVQELFNLTNNIQTMKKDNDKVRVRLDSTRDLLENTELVLEHAKKSLAEEIHLRKAYEETEAALSATAKDMRSTLQTTTTHVKLLQDKVDKTTAIQSNNRTKWLGVETTVMGTSATVRDHLTTVGRQQSQMLEGFTARVNTFVQDELAALGTSQQMVAQRRRSFEAASREFQIIGEGAREEMKTILSEAKQLRDTRETEMTAKLDSLASVAERISTGITNEIGLLQSHFETSQAALQEQLSTIFEDLSSTMIRQGLQLHELRSAYDETQRELLAATKASRDNLDEELEEDEAIAETEQKQLMTKIGQLLTEASLSKKRRTMGRLEQSNKRVKTIETNFETASELHQKNITALMEEDMVRGLQMDDHKKSLSQAVSTLWARTSDKLKNIADTTQACQHEIVQSVGDQKQHVASLLSNYDDVVDCVEAHSRRHLANQRESSTTVVENARRGFQDIDESQVKTASRLAQLTTDVKLHTKTLQDTVGDTDESALISSIDNLQQCIQKHAPEEYMPTGTTPARVQYHYPSSLPQTQPRDVIIDALRGTMLPTEQRASPAKSLSKRSPRKRGLSPTKIPSSPSKTQVFSDISRNVIKPPQPAAAGTELVEGFQETTTLREMDANILPSTADRALPEVEMDGLVDLKDLKVMTAGGTRRAGSRAEKSGKRTNRLHPSIADGRENAVSTVNAGIRAPAARRSLRNRSAE